MEGFVICKEFEQAGLFIKDWLVELAKTDVELRTLLSKEGKSIEGACKYLYSELSKGKGSNKMLMHDNEYVLGMIIDYYKDDTKVAINLTEEQSKPKQEVKQTKPKAKEKKQNPMQFDLFSIEEDDAENDTNEDETNED